MLPVPRARLCLVSVGIDVKDWIIVGVCVWLPGALNLWIDSEELTGRWVIPPRLVVDQAGGWVCVASYLSIRFWLQLTRLGNSRVLATGRPSRRRRLPRLLAIF
jgi:hypothetical protein